MKTKEFLEWLLEYVESTAPIDSDEIIHQMLETGLAEVLNAGTVREYVSLVD